MPTAIQDLEIVLIVLLIFVVGFGALANRLKTPYPILLVIGGLVLSLIPGIPRFNLAPDIVFLVVLPPLLFSAAFTTSWRDFRYNLMSIGLLAFGLVGFTVVGVAVISRWILPGFDWRLGLVLGAVVSTTDAIAATSIARRVGLPRRIIDVLEGESLINDATGLLALEFAIALVVTGGTPTLAQGAGRLLYLVIGGVAVGLALGKLVDWLEHCLDDAPIEITISLVTPYAAYLAADRIHASGVLAAVACGLFLGRRSATYFSSVVRLEAQAFWNTLIFVLNGVVFILIGLQLPYILAVSRFAHYLKAMMRDKIGSFMSRSQCETFLNNWIKNYTISDDDAPAVVKAKNPLREARVDVQEVPGKPGVYKAISYLRPAAVPGISDTSASPFRVRTSPPFPEPPPPAIVPHGAMEAHH